MKSKTLFFLVIIFILSATFSFLTETAFAAPQTVITNPQSQKHESMKKRWEWAVKESDSFRNGFWIGYSIERLMSPKSRIGSWSDMEFSKKPTLEMIIEDADKEMISSYIDNTSSLKESEENIFSIRNDSDEFAEKVIKEVAILFYFEGEAKDLKNILDITISNITLHVNLKGKPLIWLGDSEKKESVDFLSKAYHKIYSKKVRKDLITAAGLHQECPSTISFLKDVVESREDKELRKNAVFWLAEQDSRETLEFLCDIIKTDNSDKVRESAVFGISRMDTDGALEALIDIARNSNDVKVRKKAIFWLGQEASKISAEVLEKVVYDENTTEIQKQAVFALSQLEDSVGIPGLIKIAQDHPRIDVRKNAIFWLGESNDPRALDAIIEIVQNK